jgi:hypothetical protein
MFKWMMVLLMMLAACQIVENPFEIVEGSGAVITEERAVTGFSRVQINMGADLVLTQDDTESLSIQADDNLMPYILTDVRGGALVIETPDNVSLDPSQPIQVRVGFAELSEINIFGRSNVTADDLNLETLALHFAGSGSAQLTGQVANQTLTIRGQATLNNLELDTAHTRVEISGSGTVEVNASDTLDVTIAGMGFVYYAGSPQITQSISGSGTIAQR